MLKSGCTPGVDGISTEHLKYGINTVLPNILSHLFTICAQFGVIPDSFAKGILIPILKKPNSDPTDQGNYRPITVSVTLSKLFETHIMDICSSYEFSSSQYGFIPGRGGGQAIALAHDLGAFAVASGSTMFYCSLDAQGAFDFLPHTVLLNKAIDVLPDNYWICFYRWYNKMCVYTRWNAIIGNEIKVNRGTRQGGLTSPFMFNLFYKDLIQNLNKMNHGITISGYNFNAICYADDILLCSVTSTGLQKLIDDADFNIKQHGLQFNSSKTDCMLFGNSPYKNIPKWYMNNQPLNVVPSIKYLGTFLEPGNGGKHTGSRKMATQRAFYSLQGAGLNYGGVQPETAVKIYRVAVGSVLTYGCSAIYMSQSNMKSLNIIQNNQLKFIVGLRRNVRSTPLLSALSLLPVNISVALNSLKLFKSCLQSSSSASVFYKLLMKKEKHVDLEKTLYGRVHSFLSKNSSNINKYLLNDGIDFQLRQKFYVQYGEDGLTDSVRVCLKHYNDHNRNILSLLLNSY